MTITSGFFNSVNGDRRYNAEQMSALFNGLINDGIFANIGSAFGVNASSGNDITIGIGRAWFNSTWINNDAILPMTIRNSELLLDRIDAVVIEINRSEVVRAGRVTVVYGTPSGNPVRPTLTKEGDVHQYPLAYIHRAAGSSSIIQADITSMIGTSECPFVTGILEVVNIDNIVAQWQSEFETWFDGLEGMLGDDPATALANRILDLETKFSDLARDNSVYESLEDSNNGVILDNLNRPIQSRTMFALAGESTNEHKSSVIVQENDAFKVGDLLTTVRPAPDYKWRLCNGATLSRHDYPTLGEFFPYAVEARTFARPVLASGIYGLEVKRIKYINGQYVIVGYTKDYGSHTQYKNQYSAVIWYSDRLDGSWTKHTVFTNMSGSSDYKSSVNDIIYVNGYYVIVGSQCESDNTCKGFLGYSTSLTGPWTYSFPWRSTSSNTGSCDATSIVYESGHYVIGGQNKSNSEYQAVIGVINGTSPNGGISTFVLHSSAYSETTVMDVTFGNGYFMAISDNHTGSSNGKTMRIHGASIDNLSSWSQYYSLSYPSSSSRAYRIYYMNNRYIACIKYVNYSSTNIYCSNQNSTSGWTAVKVWDEENTTTTAAHTVEGIVKSDKFIVVVGSSSQNSGGSGLCLSYREITPDNSLAGGWTYQKFQSSIYDNGACNDILYNPENGMYVILYSYGNIGNRSMGIYYSDLSSFIIPSVSISDKAYTYIKVLE